MNYFIVSQNRSYKEERKGAYLWAPKLNKNKHKEHSWSTMQEVKKGYNNKENCDISDYIEY